MPLACIPQSLARETPLIRLLQILQLLLVLILKVPKTGAQAFFYASAILNPPFSLEDDSVDPTGP
jgi:hypothetical protein